MITATRDMLHVACDLAEPQLSIKYARQRTEKDFEDGVEPSATAARVLPDLYEARAALDRSIRELEGL